jgi:hypothetical protein
VVRYIDTLLTALDHSPEHIFAGGPYGAAMNSFVALSAQQRSAWTTRLGKLKVAYRSGVVMLDGMAGGDYTAASPSQKDSVLTSGGAASFLDILYTHTLEGTYSHPIYGGNANGSGWTEIKFPGPSMPQGYTPAQVGTSDGPDVIDPTGIVGMVLDALTGG